MGGIAEIKPNAERYQYSESIIKIPGEQKGGTGAVQARLTLPGSWAGKRVLCLLLDEPEVEE